jgi:basic membrane protein A
MSPLYNESLGLKQAFSPTPFPFASLRTEGLPAGPIKADLLFVAKLFHGVVQLVHLGIQFILLDDAFLQKQIDHAVKQHAVLDDHLLDLIVVFFAFHFIILVTHRRLLRGIQHHSYRGRNGDDTLPALTPLLSLNALAPSRLSLHNRAMSKNALILSLLILSLLILALIPGCNREPENTPPAPIRPSFKVGLLTPGSIHDGGWNSIAWDGLKQIQQHFGAQISTQEAKTPAQFEDGFRYYGSHGFNLAFGHGFEFQDAAMAAGKLYPKCVFITTSGSSVAPNVSPMVFQLEQSTYLLGMLAALESKNGKAGLVGGIRLPSIDSTFLAFKAGAHAVNPAFEVKEIYTGNFDDIGAAKLATQTLIDGGCDFLFHQANEAGRGVFQACQERHVRCFGSNKDQTPLAPDVVVASAVLDVPAAFVYMAGLVREHRFKPQVYWLGMNEGIVSLVWNPALKGTMKAESLSKLAEAEQKIRAGTLVVPRGKF